MKLKPILFLLSTILLLSSCQSSSNSEPIQENVKLSGLVNEEISYFTDKSISSVVFEFPKLASYELKENLVRFSLKEEGTTKFQINYNDEKDHLNGVLSIYNFAYKGERSALINQTTKVTVEGLHNGYTFSSSDTEIATVSDDGTITSLKEGKCDISLSYDGATYTKPFYVLDEQKELNKFYIEGGPVNFFGRNDFDNEKVTFYNGASGFETKFYGTSLKACMSGYFASFYGYSKMQIEIDGDVKEPVILNAGTSKKEYTLCSGLQNDLHSIKVLKMGECGATDAALYFLNTDGYFLFANEKQDLKLEVYGDSITAGYGNMRGPTAADGTNSEIQNTLKTYECIAAKKLNAQVNVMARSGIGLQYAGAITGDYNMNTRYEYMYPQSNVKWNMHNYIPDVVVINLGTNDTWDASKFVKNDFVNVYFKLVNDLIGWYGDTTKFVICCGLMSQGNPILPILKDIIYPSLVQNGIDVDYLLFKNSTSNGHPLEQEHYEAGLALAEKISNLIG